VKRPAFPIAVSTVGLAILATPAPAQDMINNLPDYTGAWVMGDLMQRRGRDDGEQPQRPRSKPPARPSLVSQASYTPSPAVEAKLETAFASYLAGQPPASAPMLLRALAADSPPGSPFTRLLAAQLGTDRARIADALKRGELQRDYGRWLSSMGYSERNLFDVNTAFLMHSWSIANNGVTTAYPKVTFREVRDDLIAQQDPQRIAGRSNLQKQEEAQSFALLTALLVSAWQDAGTQDRAVLRQGVAALGRRIGIDYLRVRLSAEGFEAR